MTGTTIASRELSFWTPPAVGTPGATLCWESEANVLTAWEKPAETVNPGHGESSPLWRPPDGELATEDLST